MIRSDVPPLEECTGCFSHVAAAFPGLSTACGGYSCSACELSLLQMCWWHELVPHLGLICISLMANDIEHLFVCLLAVLRATLEKRLFRAFDHF